MQLIDLFGHDIDALGIVPRKIGDEMKATNKCAAQCLQRATFVASPQTAVVLEASQLRGDNGGRVGMGRVD